MTQVGAPHDSSPGGLEVGGPPVLIAHRGASAVRPEHTLEAYEVAARQGADYLEPDLVSTRDHVLVARHENRLDATTDVARRPEFANRRLRRRVLEPDGSEQSVEGWFAQDFTLAELRTLRAVTRLPGRRPRSVEHDGRFVVPTFAEILDLRERLVAELGRPIGVYPETKTPEHFARAGLPLEEPLLAAVRERGLDHAGSPVVVQSFSLSALRRLRGLGSRLAHVLLLSAHVDPRTGDAVLPGAAERDLHVAQRSRGCVDALGPDRRLVLHWDASGTARPSGLVERAHGLGLPVHTWTLSPEPDAAWQPHAVLAEESDARIATEARALLDAGVEGVFTDVTDVVRDVMDARVAGGVLTRA